MKPTPAQQSWKEHGQRVTRAAVHQAQSRQPSVSWWLDQSLDRTAFQQTAQANQTRMSNSLESRWVSPSIIAWKV